MNSNNHTLYLDLVKKSLTCTQYEGLDGASWKPAKRLHQWILKRIVPKNIRLSQPTNLENRVEGKDWPLLAQTMTGMKRLDQLQTCIEAILTEGGTGDLIEIGVWRGGSTILMRAVLKSYDVKNRIVWVADSFEGLPRPDAETYRADEGDAHYLESRLAVSLETVKSNFDRYGLLDEQVKFLKGWFKDTLPSAPIDKLALIRLDGDLYESTRDGLSNLYPRLQRGGFVIIDDYGYLNSCKQAVHDYRDKHNIKEPIMQIDWTGAYWKKAI